MPVADGNVRVTLTLPPETRASLERLAQAERRTISATVAVLVEKALVAEANRVYG